MLRASRRRVFVPPVHDGPSCEMCGESDGPLVLDRCETCRTCSHCEDVSPELLDCDGLCKSCATDAGSDCDSCGGSGGGDDAALRCPHCRGRQ